MSAPDPHPVANLEPPSTPAEDSPEERERKLAWERGANRAGAAQDERLAEAWRAASDTAARAFVALAENVRDYAIFLMDPRGMITFWGEGARLIKWWTKEEAEGGHLRLLYPAGGAEDGTAEEHLRLAAVHGEYTGEGRRMRSDCSTFWAGVTLTALWDADGKLLGFAKVTRDLTARHAADGILQAASAAAVEARAAAEAANDAKTGFLATMSHEIRTPVNAIMGYLDLLGLEIGGPLTAEQRSYVERATRGSRHLLSLVSEVLDFSRLEAKQAPAIARRPFRVGDAVTHALGLVTPQARTRGIEVADAVSGFAGGLAAWGDEARVTQIVVNLLVNAVKFTDPKHDGGGRVVVSAGIAESPSPDTMLAGEGPWVYIRVEDTGTGIAADQMERIFEPFVQADMSLTRDHGGTGLGLAISRRLARAMGGEVVARSEPGVGSTFFLWLPAAPVESMQTGGVEGSGPHGEAAAVLTDAPPGPRAAHDDRTVATGLPPGSLRAMAELLLGEMERILSGFTARLRVDPETPSAHSREISEIEDHFASFIADLAGTIANVDLALEAPAEALSDGSAIQHVIAERHGAQRARRGWSEAELRREFRILRDELASALERGAPIRLPAPTAQARLAESKRAMELLDRFVSLAEEASLEGWRRGGR